MAAPWSSPARASPTRVFRRGYHTTPGEPYPLEVVGTEDEGTLTLGEFGEEQEITAPEDPLDLAELGGLGG